MFGLQKKQQESEAEKAARAEQEEARRIAAIPFPAARVPLRLVEAPKQQSYEELAQSLGFEPAELTRAQLLVFFETEKMKLYDYAQVKAWLTGKKQLAKTSHWCWRALREKDAITGFEWGRQGRDWYDGFYSSDQQDCRPYDRLVPLHALEKVSKIEAKFGNRVKFFVSDFVSPNPDPFIMVRPAKRNSGSNGTYLLIFDAWDEPGFGA